MNYMEIHHAHIDEVLKDKDNENLKTLITTDFSGVCNFDIMNMFPSIIYDDIDIISDTVKNVVIYEAIKTTSLSDLINNIVDIIKHEVYLLANDNKISVCSIEKMIAGSNTINIVDVYNVTKRIMKEYNITQTVSRTTVPISNMYNHKRNRHFITMGVYVSV